MPSVQLLPCHSCARTLETASCYCVSTLARHIDLALYHLQDDNSGDTNDQDTGQDDMIDKNGSTDDDENEDSCEASSDSGSDSNKDVRRDAVVEDGVRACAGCSMDCVRGGVGSGSIHSGGGGDSNTKGGGGDSDSGGHGGGRRGNGDGSDDRSSEPCGGGGGNADGCGDGSNDNGNVGSGDCNNLGGGANDKSDGSGCGDGTDNVGGRGCGGGENFESAPARISRDTANISIGDRLRVPRVDDTTATEFASVVGLKYDGPIAIVYDDKMWAGFKKTEDVMEALRTGVISKISEEDDVPASQRARLFLCPWNGGNPDLFLFDERIVPSAAAAAGWRWFGRLSPAPKDGTYGQRYSNPRLAKDVVRGSQVQLSGRVMRLLQMKRGEVKECLSTKTVFTVLGCVQASLPSQKSYWLVVSLAVSEPQQGKNVYVATMFGKAADDVHVKILDMTSLDGAATSHDALESSIESAMVSNSCPLLCVTPCACTSGLAHLLFNYDYTMCCCLFVAGEPRNSHQCMCEQDLLAARTTSQVNSTMATQKLLPTLSSAAKAALPSLSRGKQGDKLPSTSKGNDEDPFVGNHHLVGIGRSRLQQLSLAKLCAALKARGIDHDASATASQLIGKLEAFKRDTSLLRRKASISCDGDDSEGDSSDESGGSEDDMPPPPARRPRRNGNKNGISETDEQQGSAATADAAAAAAAALAALARRQTPAATGVQPTTVRSDTHALNKGADHLRHQSPNNMPIRDGTTSGATTISLDYASLGCSDTHVNKSRRDNGKRSNSDTTHRSRSSSHILSEPDRDRNSHGRSYGRHSASRSRSSAPSPTRSRNRSRSRSRSHRGTSRHNRSPSSSSSSSSSRSNSHTNYRWSQSHTPTRRGRRDNGHNQDRYAVHNIGQHRSTLHGADKLPPGIQAISEWSVHLC